MNSEILLPKIELSSIEPTKFNISLLQTTIVEHYKETGDSPLEMLVKAEAVIQLLEGIRTDLKEIVIQELMKYPQGKADVLGSEMSKIESGIKYLLEVIGLW